MRVIAFVPVFNEENRYLASCISWLQGIVDGIFVYDDRSDDNSLYLARHLGVEFALRDPTYPSFLTNEGLFRETGWLRMAWNFSLEATDWVLTVDADEFLVGASPHEIAHVAESQGCESVQFNIPEVFQIDPLAVRIDGFWGGITGVRMAKYQTKSTFKRGMGVGTLPEYYRDKAPLFTQSADIMHFGYADPNDRNEKYVRYTSLARNGHSSAHIQSILQPPVLNEWEGLVPAVWRGGAR